MPFCSGRQLTLNNSLLLGLIEQWLLYKFMWLKTNCFYIVEKKIKANKQTAWDISWKNGNSSDKSFQTVFFFFPAWDRLIFRLISFLMVRVNLVQEVVTKEKLWCYLFVCVPLQGLCCRNSGVVHMAIGSPDTKRPRAASQQAGLGEKLDVRTRYSALSTAIGDNRGSY